MSDEQKGEIGLAMTELDDRLRGPEGTAASAAILGRFGKLINQLEEAKQSGLDPDSFARAEALLKAVAIASKTVVAFTKFHQLSAENAEDGGNGTEGQRIH